MKKLLSIIFAISLIAINNQLFGDQKTFVKSIKDMFFTSSTKPLEKSMQIEFPKGYRPNNVNATYKSEELTSTKAESKTLNIEVKANKLLINLKHDNKILSDVEIDFDLENLKYSKEEIKITYSDDIKGLIEAKFKNKEFIVYEIHPGFKLPLFYAKNKPLEKIHIKFKKIFK